MSEKRLIVHRAGVDVSDEITLCDGKVNPFGWSQYLLVHTRREGMAEVPITIGYLNSGYPDIVDKEYTAEIA